MLRDARRGGEEVAGGIGGCHMLDPASVKWGAGQWRLHVTWRNATAVAQGAGQMAAARQM